MEIGFFVSLRFLIRIQRTSQFELKDLSGDSMTNYRSIMLREQLARMAITSRKSDEVRIIVAEASFDDIHHQNAYNPKFLDLFGLRQEDYLVLVTILDEGMENYRVHLKKAKKYSRCFFIPIFGFQAMRYVEEYLGKALLALQETIQKIQVLIESGQVKTKLGLISAGLNGSHLQTSFAIGGFNMFQQKVQLVVDVSNVRSNEVPTAVVVM